MKIGPDELRGHGLQRRAGGMSVCPRRVALIAGAGAHDLAVEPRLCSQPRDHVSAVRGLGEERIIFTRGAEAAAAADGQHVETAFGIDLRQVRRLHALAISRAHQHGRARIEIARRKMIRQQHRPVAHRDVNVLLDGDVMRLRRRQLPYPPEETAQEAHDGLSWLRLLAAWRRLAGVSLAARPARKTSTMASSVRSPETRPRASTRGTCCGAKRRMPTTNRTASRSTSARISPRAIPSPTKPRNSAICAFASRSAFPRDRRGSSAWSSGSSRISLPNHRLQRHLPMCEPKRGDEPLGRRRDREHFRLVALEALAKEASHGPYSSGFGRQGIADRCAGQRRRDSRGTPLPDGHAGAVPGDPTGEPGGGGDVLGSVRGGGCGRGNGTRGPGGPGDAGALPGSGGAPDQNGPAGRPDPLLTRRPLHTGNLAFAPPAIRPETANGRSRSSATRSRKRANTP